MSVQISGIAFTEQRQLAPLLDSYSAIYNDDGTVKFAEHWLYGV